MHSSNSQSGFSLIEILVVLLIMVSLASIVGINVIGRRDEAREKTTRIQLAQIKTGLQVYKIEQGRYPTQEQGLLSLVQKPTVEPIPARYPQEGYLDAKSVPHDGWDHAYIYLIPGRANERYELISYGSDAEPGGDGLAADISSSQL